MWTAAQVRDEVRRDLDIDEDELVTNERIYTFINSAVRDMVAEMLKLGIEDKYYETNAKLSLVNGTELYALPADIYISKIYRIIHSRPGSAEVRPVRRLRGMHEYERYHDANHYQHTNPDYAYKILNKTSGPQICLIPTPRVNETDSVTIWYARRPIKVTTGTDVVDVPEELISYILSFVKVECLKKDVGNPLLSAEVAELSRVRQVMVDTLTDIVQDADNVIEPDLSHYADMGVIV